VLAPRSSGTPVATWAWPTWVVSRRRVLEAVFILLEFPSPSRRIFIGSHSLPPLWFAVSVLQLVHLVPNSITVVSTFIHFCEAYLGISPNFLLWRFLFCVKSTSKSSGPMGAVVFCLRSGLKTDWIDSDLPDNNSGWRSEWFYIVDQLPGLPHCSSHKQ
jgi:hypothetical protein